jgi:hypothetical protein
MNCCQSWRADARRPRARTPLVTLLRLSARRVPIGGKPLILSHAGVLVEAGDFLREWRAPHRRTGCEVFFIVNPAYFRRQSW